MIDPDEPWTGGAIGDALLLAAFERAVARRPDFSVSNYNNMYAAERARIQHVCDERAQRRGEAVSLPYGIVIGHVYGSAMSPDHRLVTRIHREVGKGTTVHWTVLGRTPPQHGSGREEDFLKWATMDLTDKGTAYG